MGCGFTPRPRADDIVVVDQHQVSPGGLGAPLLVDHGDPLLREGVNLSPAFGRRGLRTGRWASGDAQVMAVANEDDQEDEAANRIGVGISLGTGLGVALGAAIGSAMGNVALGVALGVAIGAGVGSAIGAALSGSR